MKSGSASCVEDLAVINRSDLAVIKRSDLAVINRSDLAVINRSELLLQSFKCLLFIIKSVLGITYTQNNRFICAIQN